jgi:ABC-2 type transport system ATP-binding protein
MSDAPVIHAIELSRWYGIVMGLNNISFKIGPGLTGLVGPNGAGKSTLIKIITGQLQPSHGELTVFGRQPWNNPDVLRNIGFCPEEDALPDRLPARTWLRGLALLAGIVPGTVPGHVDAILDCVKLERAHWEKPLGQFSKGMRQRVKLAQALLHQPRLLVLDEPMNGLDPMGRQDIQRILKQLAAEGTTVLISRHILPELEALCPEILILNWGRVIASGSQLALQRRLQGTEANLHVRCSDPARFTRVLFEADLLLGFNDTGKEGGLDLRVKDPRRFSECLVDLLTDHNLALHELRSRDRSLQDIFEKMTE